MLRSSGPLNGYDPETGFAKAAVICLVIAGVLTLVVLSACSESEPPQTEKTQIAQAVAVSREPAYDSETLSFAVLDVLEKKLHIDTSASEPLTAAEGLCDLKLIAEEREWVKSISNAQLKAEYYRWLDYYEGQVKKRMSPQEVQKQDDKHKQIQEGRILAQVIPQPPEPKEQCVK